MEKVWLKHFGDGMPAEIDVDAYASVVAMLDEATAAFRDRPAFSNFGTTLSFAETDTAARAFAAYLQQSLGLAKGDRVAVMMPNILAFPVAMFGILRAGLIQVNVNPLYTPRELAHQLNDADTETIVIFSGSTPVLAEIIDQTPIKRVIVAQLGDLHQSPLPSPETDGRLAGPTEFADALAAGAGQTFQDVEITGDDLIYLQYTGGTTGVSKGAMLSHRNLVSNIMMFEGITGGRLEPGTEAVITALPLYHIFALMVNCLSFYRIGGENVLITNPRDMPGFVADLARRRFTAITGVNTLFNGLMHTPGFDDVDFSGLKLSIGGGTAIQAAVAERWHAMTGAQLLEGYGLSETSPILTCNPLNRESFSATIGIPLSSTDISLRDDDGKEVGFDEPGELCARGPQVMQGYWRRPEETAEAMTEDGYFRTGDIATVDRDGYFRIVDRKKDMILVSGFNVFPNEVEAVVAGMPGVVECACIGVPDERSGEAVKLFVVKAPDIEIDAAAVTAYCRENLTAYKVPRHIDFIDELPKSPVGKILRRELRE